MRVLRFGRMRESRVAPVARPPTARPPRFIAFLTIMIVGSALARAQSTGGGETPRIQTGFLDRSVAVGGSTYRFAVYVPSDYTADRAWPVLIDLHGNGAQGDDGIRQTAH